LYVFFMIDIEGTKGKNQ